MQYFASHTSAAQRAAASLRASQYQPRKRKRAGSARHGEGDSDSDSSSDASSPDHQRAASASSPVVSSSAPLADSAAQVQAAGIAASDHLEPPPFPFPHAPVRPSSRHRLNRASTQRDLAALDPPLFAANGAAQAGVDEKHAASRLRQTHLAVLTTLMHRCLLEGDYQRAGRAWGLILRSHIASEHVDLRNNMRWGIGAEILLTCKTQPTSNPSRRTHSSDEGADDPDQMTPDYLYTEEGFELAREYYDRLTIQYPNRKQYPNAINDTVFYPAMFSLWIYSVCEKTRRRRERLEKKQQKSIPKPALEDGGEDWDVFTDDEARAWADDIQALELHAARQILARLDQLTMSPPFDKHADLLRLRGLVSIWIADLVLPPERHSPPSWNSPRSPASESDSSSDVDAAKAALELSKTGLESLKKAKANGAKVSNVILDVEAKVASLQARIAGPVDESGEFDELGELGQRGPGGDSDDESTWT